jgi:CBS domain-containing protein
MALTVGDIVDAEPVAVAPETGRRVGGVVSAPVIGPGRLVGVVTRSDVLEALTREG